MDQCVTVGL